MTFLGEKCSFSQQKFLMTFFQIFPCFSQIFACFAMLNVIFDPFLTRKTPFFTLLILSRASDNTTSLNIGEGPMHGPSPHLKFGGPPPQSPLGLRPCRLPY